MPSLLNSTSLPPRSRHEVVVVGAGAAGVGMAATLKDFGLEDFVVLDRHGIGASFERWPEEMRLITPSFNSTPFGQLDLNAVTPNTSVANFLGEEHPTGQRYAAYLRAVVAAMKLPVITPWDVARVEKIEGEGFRLSGAQGVIECHHLIWAGGEFQFPCLNPFPGSCFCQHSATIPSYGRMPGEDFVVIGAFESGVDAAVHLASRGKGVTLLCAASELALADQDPSRALTPFTRGRLQTVLTRTNNLQICTCCRVTEVDPCDGGFRIRTEEGREFACATAPILATGFRGGTGPVSGLFEHDENGHILLTDEDESTCTRGLYLAGPLVRHETHIFCYIYKFRQRFAVIAEDIAVGLGIDIPDEVIATYERQQMRLVDLSCCGNTCAC